MATLLNISASARQERSITRALGDEFKQQWRELRPTDNFRERDVGITPPGFVSEPWIAAAFTPEDNRTDEQKSLLVESDTYIEELSSADVITITTPMYNYGMPASLKAWVDQVVRVNKTFTFDLKRGDVPLAPILSGKQLVLITSAGEFGFAEGGIRQSMNHLEPHIHTVSKYLGVEDIAEIRVEYQEFGDTRHKQSIEKAYQAIPDVVTQISQKVDLLCRDPFVTIG